MSDHPRGLCVPKSVVEICTIAGKCAGRFALNGIRIRSHQDGSADFTTTDGKRLAKVTVRGAHRSPADSEWSVVVPAKTFLDVVRGFATLEKRCRHQTPNVIPAESGAVMMGGGPRGGGQPAPGVGSWWEMDGANKGRWAPLLLNPHPDGLHVRVGVFECVILKANGEYPNADAILDTALGLVDNEPTDVEDPIRHFVVSPDLMRGLIEAIHKARVANTRGRQGRIKFFAPWKTTAPVLLQADADAIDTDTALSGQTLEVFGLISPIQYGRWKGR